MPAAFLPPSFNAVDAVAAVAAALARYAEKNVASAVQPRLPAFTALKTPHRALTDLGPSGA